MEKVLIAIVLLVNLAFVAAGDCDTLYKEQGLSSNYNETIAHAIHSMTVQGLRLFNRRATENNKIPTVNADLSSSQKVLPYAPDVSLGTDFTTEPMNRVDDILGHIGNEKDGLGPNWSPIERVAHKFHMQDLWETILPVYGRVVESPRPPTDQVCGCLLDTASNGIYDAVEWIAKHYESGTPITLLNRPIPKLTDANAWAVWKSRLLYYYDTPALHDAAVFLYCATKDF